MTNKKSIKGAFSIKKTWFEPVNSFEFVIEDYINENLEVKTRIIYDNYQPKLNKAQEAKRAIQDYIRLNSLSSITRKEVFDNTLASLSSIKMAIKELLEEGYLVEEGQTKNKIFMVNTEFFKPN